MSVPPSWVCWRLGSICLPLVLLSLLQAQPLLLSVDPATGLPGDLIALRGSGFSAVPTNNSVWFGAVRARVLSSASDTLQVAVPVGASYGPISVSVGGRSAMSARFFKPRFDGLADITANSLGFVGRYATGPGPGAVQLLDMDGDGRVDVVIANSETNSLSLLPNRSADQTVVLGAAIEIVVGRHPSAIASGDFDGDGAMDLVVANRDSGYVSILHNVSIPGQIAVATAGTIATGAYPVGLAVADLDGDGRPDLVTANNTDPGTLSVFRNTTVAGNLAFTPALTAPCLRYPMTVLAADLDGDGKADLASVHLADRTVALLRNTSALGSITFGAATTVATGPAPASAFTADLDDDGRCDFLVANSQTNTLSVLRNASTPGTLAFTPQTPLLAGNAPRTLAVACLDGDPRLDVVVGTVASPPLAVLRNTAESGGIAYATATAFDPGGAPAALAIGDLDNDGRPDLVVATPAGGGSVAVFRNLTPTPLRLLTQPQSQTLSWGGEARFDVGADGAPPLFYQWFRGQLTGEAEALADETNATLVLTSAFPYNSGSYFAVVSNLFQSVTSQVAQLVVKGFVQSQIDDAAPGATVLLPDGAYGENVFVGKDLQIAGSSAARVALDGGGNGTVLTVTNGVRVSLVNLTLTNGNCTLAQGAGGIQNWGELALSNCVVAGNHGASGGGVFNAGTLWIADSSIAANRVDATEYETGGGLYNAVGSATLIRCTLASNVVSFGAGGGIGHYRGVLALTNCTVSGNQTIESGGAGIANMAALTLAACTITANTALGGRGGGLFNAGSATLIDTLLAGNEVQMPVPSQGTDCFGNLTSLGHNLIGNNLDCGISPAAGDKIGTANAPIDPGLSPLADNGGPTLTHALLPGSPALDAATTVEGVSSDQRGMPRVSDGNGDALPIPDIGAFEYQNTPPLTTALAAIEFPEDTPSPPIPFGVWDTQTSPADLTVSAFCSDPGLVPSGGIVLSGNGPDRALVLLPATNQFGRATVFLTVSDGLASVTNSFAIVVVPVNDPPVIDPLPDTIVGQGRTASVAFDIGDVETPPAGLLVRAVAADSDLVPPSGLSIEQGPANRRTLHITPASTRAGTTTVTCTVTDAEGASADSTFTLTVQAPPVITVQPASLTTTNCAAVTLSATVAGDSVSYRWRLNGSELPNATNTTLTLPCVGDSQTGNYTLVATNHGGSVTSAAALVRVTSMPTISLIPNQITVSGRPTGPLTFLVSDVETPASSLIVTVTSSDSLLVPPSNLVLGGSGSVRTIDVTPSATLSGGATILLTVTDTDGGTTSAGFSLTVGKSLAFTLQPPTSLSVTQGNSATLTASAVGYGGVSYQWRFNGAAIAGATGASLSFQYVQPVQEGAYSVEVSYGYGSIISGNTTLHVHTPPSIITGLRQDIALYPGWNLIAFQVGLGGFTPAEFVQSLDRTNAVSEIWGYEPANRTWHTFKVANTNLPSSVVLAKLLPGRGYWVRMSQGAVASLQGSPWVGTNALAPGWNLVGFPGVQASTTETLGFDSIFRDQLARFPQIWTFDGSGQRFKGYDSAARPAIADITAAEPGRGYWIYGLDGGNLAPSPFIALPPDSDISPLQEEEPFNPGDPRFIGHDPTPFIGRLVRYAANEDFAAGVDLNNNGILDDPYTQDTLIFDEGVSAQNISIGNLGAGLINWAVQSSIPWLSVDPPSGVVGSEVDSLALSVDRAGLLPGVYSNFVFAVQAGSLTKYIRVILKVPNISGDYRGAATVTRVNGKPIAIGKVDLNFTMFGDSGDSGSPAFRAVIDREKALLFPKDVFLNGIFYAGNDFSLTTGFETPASDRNAPPYNTFTHTGTNVPYGDKDWNGNGKMDNQNPFPFAIRREVTLLGRRTTPDHLEGTYVEAIQNMLPNDQRIYLEGTFALDRESRVPTRKSIYNGKSTNAPVQIGGSTGGITSYTNVLTVTNAVVLEGVTVKLNIDFGTPALLDVKLIAPGVAPVYLQRFSSSSLSNATFIVTGVSKALPGNWQLVVSWNPVSGERGNFRSWELNLEGLVVYTLGGRVAVVEGGQVRTASDVTVTLAGSNILPTSKPSTDGTFLFNGLTENDYSVNVSRLGYQDTNIFVRITGSSVDLGTIILQPVTNTEPTLLAAPFVGYAPLYVRFKFVGPPSILTDLGADATATWDFGDGSPIKDGQPPGATLGYTYTNAGVYRATVTVYGRGGKSWNLQTGNLTVLASSPNPFVAGNYFIFGGGQVGSMASPIAPTNLLEVTPTGANAGILYQESKRDTAAFDVDRFPSRANSLDFHVTAEDTEFAVPLGSPFYTASRDEDRGSGPYFPYPQPTYGGTEVADRFRIFCTMGGYVAMPDGGAVWSDGCARVGNFILQVGRVEP